MSGQHHTNGRIAVFGPGAGALSISSELQRAFPHAELMHLADTTFAPYGTRSGAQIEQLLIAGIRGLLPEEPSVIVIGCNTSSTQIPNALQTLQRTHVPHPPVIGILEPTVHMLAHQPFQRLALAATPFTVSSGFYPTRLAQLAPTVQVCQFSVPTLPSLIDSGAPDAECRTAIKQVFEPWLAKTGAVDGLALCCTHYPYFLETFREIAHTHLGHSVPILTQGGALIPIVAEELSRQDRTMKWRSSTQVRIFETGNSPSFQLLAERTLRSSVARSPHWTAPSTDTKSPT